MIENRVRHVCLKARTAESYGKERVRRKEEKNVCLFLSSMFQVW